MGRVEANPFLIMCTYVHKMYPAKSEKKLHLVCTMFRNIDIRDTYRFIIIMYIL